MAFELATRIWNLEHQCHLLLLSRSCSRLLLSDSDWNVVFRLISTIVIVGGYWVLWFLAGRCAWSSTLQHNKALDDIKQVLKKTTGGLTGRFEASWLDWQKKTHMSLSNQQKTTSNTYRSILRASFSSRATFGDNISFFAIWWSLSILGILWMLVQLQSLCQWIVVITRRRRHEKWMMFQSWVFSETNKSIFRL